MLTGGRIMLSYYSVCNSKKNRFIKEQTAKQIFDKAVKTGLKFNPQVMLFGNYK